MKEPMLTNRVPDAYYETVKATHEKGDFTCIGYDGLHTLSHCNRHTFFHTLTYNHNYMIHYLIT